MMSGLKRLKPGWGLLPVAVFLAIWETVAQLAAESRVFSSIRARRLSAAASAH